MKGKPDAAAMRSRTNERPTIPFTSAKRERIISQVALHKTAMGGEMDSGKVVEKTRWV